MMNSTLLNRSGLAAIAAATAFLSTPALAQDVTPVAADAAPVVADTPSPAEPAATPDAASDPLAPAATTATRTTRTTRTTRPTRAAAAPAARPARAPAPAPAARAAAVAPAPAVAEPAAEAAPAFDPAMVAPLPEPAVAAPAPVTNDSMIDNDLLPIAGAAGLAILGLAGAGLAMRRRRRDEDDVVVEETFHEPVIRRAVAAAAQTAPIATAPLVARPAFDWGKAPTKTAPARSRIEAARRGPTPDNPSLSLKKRLQRAAFFDRHERQVAAGKAEPMSPMAGLPDALAAMPAPATAPPVRTDYAIGKSHNRSFQPA